MFYADRMGLRTNRTGETVTTANPWLRLWAPHRLAWWVAVVFVVGTVFFVAGAAGSLAPSLFGGQHRMSVFAESCYFAGAVLYSIGIYGQLFEGVNSDEHIGSSRESYAPKRFHWLPQRADFARLEILAPFVFLVGSLTFNYETTFALGSVLDVLPRFALWQTTMIGSVFFLLAAALQFIEAGHRYLSLEVRDVSWWIAALFILGSIGFIAGSLPGLGTPGMPNAGEGYGPLIVKLGFLTGSLAYLAGSYLMLPELFTQLRYRSITRAQPNSLPAEPTRPPGQ